MFKYKKIDSKDTHIYAPIYTDTRVYTGLLE